MTPLLIFLAGGGAAVGAIARYSVGQWFAKINNSPFPWGTWVINIAGTILLGLFAQWFEPYSTAMWVLLGTGFCGGFTTFSTMSVETVRLFRVNVWLALVYIISSFGIGMIVAWMIQLWL